MNSKIKLNLGHLKLKIIAHPESIELKKQIQGKMWEKDRMADDNRPYLDAH